MVLTFSGGTIQYIGIYEWNNPEELPWRLQISIRKLIRISKLRSLTTPFWVRTPMWKRRAVAGISKLQYADWQHRCGWGRQCGREPHKVAGTETEPPYSHDSTVRQPFLANGVRPWLAHGVPQLGWGKLLFHLIPPYRSNTVQRHITVQTMICWTGFG